MAASGDTRLKLVFWSSVTHSNCHFTSLQPMTNDLYHLAQAAVAAATVGRSQAGGPVGRCSTLSLEKLSHHLFDKNMTTQHFPTVDSLPALPR